MKLRIGMPDFHWKQTISCFNFIFSSLNEFFSQVLKGWTRQNKYFILFIDYQTHQSTGLLVPIDQDIMVHSKGFLRFTLLLSILVGAITPLCHEWLSKSEVDINLPENWKEMSDQGKLNSLDALFSTNAAFPLLSKIKQLSIRRQFKTMVGGKQDEVLRDGFRYSIGFRFCVGWKELGLLGLVGFASVWMIYAVLRVATWLIPSAPIIHFPSPPLRGRVESLHLPIWREPISLATVRITLFGFLTLEERPQRPPKPGGVWID